MLLKIMWISKYTQPNKNLFEANRFEPVMSPSSIFLCMKFLNLFMECWGPVKYDGKKNTWLVISKIVGTSFNAFNFWSLLNDSWNINSNVGKFNFIWRFCENSTIFLQIFIPILDAYLRQCAVVDINGYCYQPKTQYTLRHSPIYYVLCTWVCNIT